MLKQNRRVFNILCFLGDIPALLLAFVSAHHLRGSLLPRFIPNLVDRPFYPLTQYLPILLLAWLALLISLFFFSAYRRSPGVPLASAAVANLEACLVAFVLSLALANGLKMQWLSRLFLGILIFLFWVFSTAIHHLLAVFFRRRASKGIGRRVVVFVGCGAQGREVARKLLEHLELGIAIRGFFLDSDGLDPSDQEDMQRLGIPLLGDLGDLIPFTRREVVDGVIFAVDTGRLGRMEDLFLQCEDLGLDTLVAANLFPHLVARVQLEHLEELPLLRFTTVPQNTLALALKRGIDIFGSAIGLLFLSPFLGAIALLVKASSPGPVFFRQERVGLNGRRFTLYKFRTMVVGAEKMLEGLRALNEVDGPVFKIKRDPRLTRVGSLLRKSSMDELPQLWNVLRGEMSLVGPRPPIPSEVDLYERWQRRRLSMRPGITCLWQISGRSELDFNRWMKLDLQYIDNWSLLLDFVILLKTIPAVLSTRGAA